MKRNQWVRAICVLAVLAVVFVSVGVQPAQAASLTLNKTNYTSGETITVNYSPSAPSELAWIGIVPSEVAHNERTADENDSDYKYAADYPGGTLQLQAPSNPGSYDVRYYSNDDGGAEIASVTFTVGMVTTGTLSLNKTNYAPQEAINVTFGPTTGLSDKAWIGVIPASIAHGSEVLADANDSDFEYASDHPGGTLQLSTPDTPGSYNVRFYSDDLVGVELASVNFTVGMVTTGNLSLNKTNYATSETINVTFSPTTGLPDKAWIGVVPANITHGSEVLADENDSDFEYVSDHPGGTLQLSAPDTPGAYDVRFFSDDVDGAELASFSFTVGSSGVNPGGNGVGPVTGGSTGQNQGIVLTAAPGNSQVELTWTIPDGMTGIFGFNLYRGTSAGGELTSPLTDFVITVPAFTDRKVVDGTTYYYILKPVYNDTSLGASSNEVSATPFGSSNSGTTGTNVIVLQIGNPNVQVNGVTTVIDAPATIVEGRTMVPLRFIGEAMGGTVDWDGTVQQITLFVRNTEILLWVGSTRTVVNGQDKYTDVPPQIINGRTMVPLRFILENLNCQVNWDSATQTVTIIY